MKIEFTGDKVNFRMKREIRKAVKLTLRHLHQSLSKILVSITFLNEDEMKELNNRTRGMNKVTDVLSYPNFNLQPFELIDVENKDNYTGREIFLGDMAICLKRAEQQAEEYNHSLSEEVVKLVIHSILHMMGFDHIEDSDFVVMNQEEEKIASKFYKNKKF